MKAGAAAVDITPKPGTHLGGSLGGHRASQTVLDPLHARAAVFSAGNRMICFLALDAILITREYTDRIRNAAALRFGLDPEAIMVHVTHTHAAPSLGHFMVDDEFPEVPSDRQFVRGGDLSYAGDAANLAVEAIGRALESMEEVAIATNRGAVDGIAFSRRAVLRDGKVVSPWIFSSAEYPAGRGDILYMEGPIDPEVGVLCARNAAGCLVTMLLAYTCHPVNEFSPPGGGTVSADWPGAWAREMQGVAGKKCIPVVLNGCAGNINPTPPFQADFVRNHRRMGRILGEVSSRILAGMRFTNGGSVDHVTRTITLRVREVPATEREAAERYLKAHPEPPWSKDEPNLIEPEWSRAAWIQSIELLRRRSPEVPYEIQAFRVGDAAFVSLPGEPFVEGQLAIKLASPFSHTQIAGCTTQYIGYFPTHDAYPRGGHEPFFSKVVPGTLEQIVAAAIEALHELHSRILS